MNEKKRFGNNFILDENGNYKSVDAGADINNNFDNRNSSESTIELKSSRNKKSLRLPKKKMKKSNLNIETTSESSSELRLKSKKGKKRNYSNKHNYLIDNVWNNRKDLLKKYINEYFIELNIKDSSIPDIENYIITIIKQIFKILHNNNFFDRLNKKQIRKISPFILDFLKKYLNNFNISIPKVIQNKVRNVYGFIYLSTNTLSNNKKYVGLTAIPRTVKREWSDKVYQAISLSRKRQENPNKRYRLTYIHNAIAKYGKEAWTVELIDIAFSEDELKMKETFWIKHYNTINTEFGYNRTEGGDIRKWSKEAKKSLSKLMKDPEIRAKWKKSVEKTHNSPEYKAQISKSMIKFYENNPEYKDLVGENSRKLWAIPEKKEERLKKIIQKNQSPEGREKIGKGVKEVWAKKNLIKKLNKINFEKEHQSLRDFLSDKIDIYHGEAWKQYIIHILKIVEYKSENKITSYELADSLGFKEGNKPNFSHKDHPIMQLIKDDYIQKIKPGKLYTPNIFSLTNLGLKKAKELLNELENKINLKKEHQSLRDFLSDKIDEPWKQYLIHMLKIIEYKSENKITSYELADSLGFKKGEKPNFCHGIYPVMQLIKDGYIQKTNGEKLGTPNIFSLTDLGLNTARELLNKLKRKFKDN